MLCDKEGNIISRIEVSFNHSTVFKEQTYTDVIKGELLPKTSNENSIIDNCCLEIKTKEKHEIIFEGEKKFGRVIYIN